MLNHLALDLGLVLYAAGYDGLNLAEFHSPLEIKDHCLKNKIEEVVIGRVSGEVFEFMRDEIKKECEAAGLRSKVVSEHKTSILCPSCMYRGYLVDRLFKCRRCKIVMNRDHVGAINIYKSLFGALKERVYEPEPKEEVLIVLPPASSTDFLTPLRREELFSLWFDRSPLLGRIDIEF